MSKDTDQLRQIATTVCPASSALFVDDMADEVDRLRAEKAQLLEFLTKIEPELGTQLRLELSDIRAACRG